MEVQVTTIRIRIPPLTLHHPLSIIQPSLQLLNRLHQSQIQVFIHFIQTTDYHQLPERRNPSEMETHPHPPPVHSIVDLIQ